MFASAGSDQMGGVAHELSPSASQPPPWRWQQLTPEKWEPSVNRCLLIFCNEVEVAGCFCQMGSSAEEAIQPFSSESLLQENGVGLKQEEGNWGSTVNSQYFPKGSCQQKVDLLEYFAA